MAFITSRTLEVIDCQSRLQAKTVRIVLDNVGISLPAVLH